MYILVENFPPVQSTGPGNSNAEVFFFSQNGDIMTQFLNYNIRYINIDFYTNHCLQDDKIPLSCKFHEFPMKSPERRKFTQINPNLGP